MKKRVFCFALALAITFAPTVFIIRDVRANSLEDTNTDDKMENEIKIELNNSKISVNDKDISTDSSADIYLSKKIETHTDVAKENLKVENTVINIKKAGNYRISGTLSNGQINVDAGDNDKVNIILDNANITCSTAPAILIANAQETKKEGESGVKIILAKNSKNNLVGSHVAEYYDNNKKIKNDGAISSNVSLGFEGSGELNITADKEGIESKLHLTFDGGNININAADDSINASEDNVSHLIVNGGNIFANSNLGTEGDGIDSNGYITINGGNVIAIANEKSMDSGLDSDLGIKINAGTVVATGSMFDEVDSSSSQKLMQLVFKEKQKANSLITIMDKNDNPVMAFKSPYGFTDITFASSNFEEGDYHIYTGGNIQGNNFNGLYTEEITYTKGIMQGNTASGMFGQRPAGLENREPPAKPEGNENSQPPEKPQSSNENSEELAATNLFTINNTSHVFRNVSNFNNANVSEEESINSSFSDIPNDNKYAEAIKYVAENGIMNGTSKTTFSPTDSLTRAMAVSIIYNLEKNGLEDVAFKDIFDDVKEGDWFSSQIIWGNENEIIFGLEERKFFPNTNITLEQFVKIIYNYANSKGYDLSFEDDSTFDFSTVSEWAEEPMKYAVNTGILSNITKATKPQDSINREQVASILAEFIKKNNPEK